MGRREGGFGFRPRGQDPAAPPGDEGTMILTACSGKSCALARETKRASAATPLNTKRTGVTVISRPPSGRSYPASLIAWRCSLNTAGNTNSGYFGLTWGITLIQNLFGWGGSVFANGSLGGALQDGYTNSAPPDRKMLGSTALFRESVELGYQLTPNVSVSGFVDHMSNADLAQHNAGITDAGARLGFKF